MIITSTSNPRVKRLVNLKKKRRMRDEEQVFLTEGIRMFREVPLNSLKEVYVSEAFHKKEQKGINEILKESKIRPEILADHVFAYVSDTKSPQGILCVVEQPKQEYMGIPEEGLQGAPPFYILLDNLQDPGNMGTIIRTAEGAGVTGIIMSKDCVDVYNPKVIRSTMGSIYRMPVWYVQDLKTSIRLIKDRGIRTYAAHLDGKVTYDRADYTGPCAFLIGNEGNGLRKEVAELADEYIRIPMEGQVESLNAAIAATVLMFEAGRQRRNV